MLDYFIDPCYVFINECRFFCEIFFSDIFIAELMKEVLSCELYQTNGLVDLMSDTCCHLPE